MKMFLGTKAQMEKRQDHIDSLEPVETEADITYHGGGRHCAKSVGLKEHAVNIIKHPKKNQYGIIICGLVQKHDGKTHPVTGDVIDISKGEDKPEDWQGDDEQ